jgi:hypothetical protein
VAAPKVPTFVESTPAFTSSGGGTSPVVSHDKRLWQQSSAGKDRRRKGAEVVYVIELSSSVSHQGNFVIRKVDDSKAGAQERGSPNDETGLVCFVPTLLIDGFNGGYSSCTEHRARV